MLGLVVTSVRSSNSVNPNLRTLAEDVQFAGDVLRETWESSHHRDA
jgi:hypothetical protein